jgi:hypothetical protein
VRGESSGGGVTAADCGGERLGLGEEEAAGVGEERKGNGSGLKWGGEERAASAREKRSGGSHAGPASGRRSVPPRGRPTGRRRGMGGTEGEADAWARARGRERS